MALIAEKSDTSKKHACRQKENNKHKMRNLTQNEAIDGGKSRESESSIDRIDKMKKVSDKKIETTRPVGLGYVPLKM